MALIAEGKTSKEVAQVLRISYRTVEVHRTHIRSKLRAESCAELIRMAILGGLS